MRQRCRGATANDSNSPKVHRRESYPYHCTHKAGNIYSVQLYIYKVVILLLPQRRGAAGSGLGATARYLRRTTSGAAGNGLGTAAKYLRQITSGAAGFGLGAMIK
jgi:hypothetical protein